MVDSVHSIKYPKHSQIFSYGHPNLLDGVYVGLFRSHEGGECERSHPSFGHFF